ncbi:MAG: copper chaperone PCu(A)C [candidate division WOR-3 bacterium]
MRKLIFLILISCTYQKSGIEIEDPYARIGIKGGSSAAFMKIKNYEKMPDTLYEAICNCSNVTEIHETIMKGDIMEMHKKDFLVIDKQVELKPMGLHIMLIDLKDDLKENDTIEITLKFKKSGNKKVKVPVRRL